MTELVNFIFHIMKISNFRHKLALSRWCVFKVLQYSNSDFSEPDINYKIRKHEKSSLLFVVWENKHARIEKVLSEGVQLRQRFFDEGREDPKPL